MRKRTETPRSREVYPVLNSTRELLVRLEEVQEELEAAREYVWFEVLKTLTLWWIDHIYDYG